MIRVCVWIGIFALFAGCGPRDTYICDEQHSAVADARSLTSEQLSELSERLMELHGEMQRYGTYPVPDDLDYLGALHIRLDPKSDVQIMLAGCLDEFIYLTLEMGSPGAAQIRLSWVGGPNPGSEVLWRGSAVTDDGNVEEQLEALIASQYQEISLRYLTSADDFDRLTDRMAQERDVMIVHCDENLRYVQTRTSIFYEGEDSDILTTYLELCSFEKKVVANAGHATGISFPHQLKEIGPIQISTHLVHRLDGSIDFERCTEVSLDEQWGDCQEPIGGPWSAHYTWGPVCFDDAGPEEGC